MRTLTLILGLRKVHDAFEYEMKRAMMRTETMQFYLFLRSLTAYTFIDQVVTACAMYPRSYEASRDNLQDLSFGISNELGLGRYTLSHRDKENLSKLVLEAGTEVLGILSANGYFIPEHHVSKWAKTDDNYDTDLEAISHVTRISAYSYEVALDEYELEINQYAEPIRHSTHWTLQ